MRIVINARFLTQKLTGVQRFAIELSRQLKLLNAQVVFVTPHNIIQHEAAAELEAIVIGKRKGVAWEQIELPVYLKKMGAPLLINLCNVAPLFYNNQVITLHDVAFYANPGWFSKTFVWYYKFLIPKIVRNSKLIFTVSEFSKNEIIKYFNPSQQKVKVIYNGISALPAPVQTDKHNGRYILCVGSIDERKNIKTLISAFNAIRTTGYQLVIVGDKNHIFNTREDKDGHEKTGEIIYTGRVTDGQLADLYAGADLFVYPSLYEGFGIPPLEAMHYGCPTLVADIPSLREVCGEGSLYVDPLDATAMASKMDLLLNNPQLRQQLTERGIKNITRFSWKVSASEVLKSIALINK